MKLIITTKYPELVRFLFSNLRYETTFPNRDNFFLMRNITNREYMLLDRYNEYVVITESCAEEEWDRQEIVDYCKKQLKSRRKPEFENISDIDFAKSVKVFWITGRWLIEDSDLGVYKLYKSIDCKVNRWKEYFTLREEEMSAEVIFSSLLTFVNKAHNFSGNYEGIAKGYGMLLRSKQGGINKNYRHALYNYYRQHSGMDKDMKVLRFIMDLGGGYQ